jgi:DNA-binding response OmpR family regulator
MVSLPRLDRVIVSASTCITKIVRILIIDEYTDAAEMMSDMLTKLGHECTVTPSLDEAQPIVASLAPEIIFVDVGRPRVLRDRLLAFGRIAFVVALSAWKIDDLEPRFDAYLVKPFSLQQLTDVIATAERERPLS